MSLDPASLAPERNPNLVQRIWRAFVGAQPDLGPQAQTQQTTETGQVDQAAGSRSSQLYATATSTRRASYADADEMDDTSAEFSVALDTIADNVTSSEDGEQQTFEVTCDDAGVLKVLDETIARAKLHDIMPAWVRTTVKYGDSFGEIVVNNNLEVAAVKQLPPRSVERNEDQFGNLVLVEPKYEGSICQNAMGECAFEQRAGQTDQVIAAFYPWQLAHLRMGWDGLSRYGRGLGHVGRNDWRKLKALEEGMIVGRLTRAYLKLIVYADATGKSPEQTRQMLKELAAQIGQTSQWVEQRRNRELTVLDNIYLSKNYVRTSDGVKESQTKVDLIDPKNEALQGLDDVHHFHRKFLATVRVPPAFMAFEDDINAKATLTGEALQYARFVRRIQGLMSAGLSQVLDIALILAGYDPDAVDYEIGWPKISSEDEAAMATANFQQAQADDIYEQKGVIDKGWMQQHRFGMDEEEAAAIEEPKPEPAPIVAAPPKAPVAAERVFPALEALAVGQMRILDRLHPEQPNGNGHTVLAEPTTETHLHLAEGALRVTVEPRINVQPAAPPNVQVDVQVPEQPPAQVTVRVPQQSAPDVIIQPAIEVRPTPVKAPDVNVTVQAPAAPDLEIERDRAGNIKSIHRNKNKN